MSLEWPEIIVASAAGLGLVGGASSWLYTRITDVRKEAREELAVLRRDLNDAVREDERTHADLHDRINKTRETYTPKVDFEKDVDRLEKRFNDGMRELSEQLRNMGAAMTQRLDAIVAKFNGGGHDRS